MALTYGLAMFVWVLVLSGAFTRTTFFALTFLDVLIVISRLWAPMQSATTGPGMWMTISEVVYDIWLASIVIVVCSVALKSTLVAKLRGHRVDILTNPKKRFVLPIGVWAAMVALPTYLQNYLPDSVLENRFRIAGQILVWGWVALELPFYLSHKRLMRDVR